MTLSRESANSSSSPGIRYVFTRKVFGRNCAIAAIVGCLLTLTNQLDVLIAQPFSFRLGTKIVFNFLIPFAVSSTSAFINRT